MSLIADWTQGGMAFGPPPERLPASPPDHGCRLWLIDLTQGFEEAAWQACSEDEHARASRFRFERDATRYRAAHAGLRQKLAQALGTTAQAIRWHTGEHGKPHLLDHEGWHFNLSHSGDWALLGLSQGLSIGVDIECHKATPDLPMLVRHQFSPAEQASYFQAAESDRPSVFLRTWACKEACLKAMGCGLSMPTTDLDTVWSSHWTEARARTTKALLTPFVRGLTLPDPLASQMAAAVALIAPDVLPRQW